MSVREEVEQDVINNSVEVNIKGAPLGLRQFLATEST